MIALFAQMDLISQNLFKSALNAMNPALRALALIIATANNVRTDIFWQVMVLFQLANYAKLDALNALLNYTVMNVQMAFIYLALVLIKEVQTKTARCAVLDAKDALKTVVLNVLMASLIHQQMARLSAHTVLHIVRNAH